MTKKDETREKLITELAKLRQHIIKLEKSETENKLAAEALRESEEKFRSIAECSPNMIFINRKGRVVYANKKCEEIIGYKRKEFYSSDFDFLTLIAKESQNLIKTNYQRHLNGEEVLPYEYTIITKKGKKIEAIITTKLINYGGDRAIMGIVTDITARKKAEEELRRSRDEHISVTNLTGDIIVKIDKEGRWTFLNDGACKFWGKPREKLLGVKFADYLHADDGKKTAAAVQKMIKTKQIVRCVINRQETPTGWRTVEWNANPIFDEAGKYAGMQATGRDITERKKAEEDLRESEERYRDLVEKADIAIVMDDKEGNFKYFNKKFADLFGYSEEKMKKQSIHTVVHPDDARWVIEFHKARFHGGNIPSRYEFKGVRKDGSTIYLEVDAVELKEEESTIGTRSYIWDITERKMAEEELRESEEKFRSVVVNSSDAIISVNAQGNIDFWNPAAQDVFGYSSEEAIGKPYEIILHKRFHTVFKKTFKQIVFWKRLGIIENRTEMVGLRKDGRKFPMEVSISSWMTKEGIFFSSSIRDITEQKKATDELKKEYDALKNSAGVDTKGN